MNTALIWDGFSRNMRRYLMHRVKNRRRFKDQMQQPGGCEGKKGNCKAD